MIHIHNGDIVALAAKRTGLPGDHVVFRESLVTGPVIPGDDWLETRARAIAEGHEEDLLRVRTSLLEQEQMISAAPSRGEIVLWFEHDLYCFVHLVYLLQRLGNAELSMVWCPTPLAEREEELSLLFESRSAVEGSLVTIARDVWAAYTSPDPTGLNRFLEMDQSEFPFLREGLRLHASRFPSTANGLGAIEQQALELIAAGVADFGSIFERIGSLVPPFGFGDQDIMRHLRRLATRPAPLVTIGGEFPQSVFALTPSGASVLRGETNDVTVNPPDVWLGGAHVTNATLWTWNGRWIEER